MHSQLEMSNSIENSARLSVPSLKQRVRALSSGRLEKEESKRKALSFRENSNLMLDAEAMSDDDKNKIELIEGDMDLAYEPTQIKEI